MLERKQDSRKTANILDIESLVPANHPLRALEAALDWERVYGLTAGRYSPDKGRKSIDPVVLVKILFLQRYYDLPSIQHTLEEVQVNLAYRWFLGFDFVDKLPHPSTVTKNIRQRFVPEALEALMAEYLQQAQKRRGRPKRQAPAQVSMAELEEVPVEKGPGRV